MTDTVPESTALDIDRIEALARAAEAAGESSEWFRVGEMSGGIGWADQHFIAALSPAVVLALVAQLRAATADIVQAQRAAWIAGHGASCEAGMVDGECPKCAAIAAELYPLPEVPT